jgi:predicted TIM-barrel fold metal-dependent hydrolase
VGWIVREAGAEIPLFSSDYPHVEGGRNPIKRFEASLGEFDPATRELFYHANFAELMGTGLSARLEASTRT